MHNNHYYYIPKWETESNSPLLFFPDYEANEQNIVCYAFVGQHSEASLAYYRMLRKPKTPQQLTETQELVSHYAKHFLDSTECMMEVLRDTTKFKRIRYNRKDLR